MNFLEKIDNNIEILENISGKIIKQIKLYSIL
jgi:hypothetical protein